MITAILNVYNRKHLLEQQIEAIKKQTVPPEEIWIWVNHSDKNKDTDFSNLPYKVISSNHNFKFHGRFALGMLAKTEFVAFFDDDTIPGEQWFENCLATVQSGNDGILGSAGIILTETGYQNHLKVGHNNGGNESLVEVDLVGHSWFMAKNHLRYLWYKEPYTWDNGEDMQLSFQAQKFGGIKTFVPKHPKGNTQLWGSLPEFNEHDSDENASHKVLENHLSIRDEIVIHQLSSGWKTVRSKNHLIFQDLKNRLRQSYPSIYRFLK